MTTLSNLQKYLEKIKKEDKKINAFLQLRGEKELIEEARKIDAKKNKGKLAGKIIAVKSNICVKGLNASCASRTLENYKAPYDAGVIEKIKKEDGLIIGMTNMDEFACGGSGETSAFGVTQNPSAFGLIPGGSSSGSAASIAAGFCDMALGSDTGGSIRNPASHCGVVGIKPTYPSVSRYGLIDLSMSLDQIGTFAKNVEDAGLLLNVIQGKDEKDSISMNSPSVHSPSAHPKKKFVIGVLNLEGLKVDKRIQELINKRIHEVAGKENWKIKKIKLNYIDLAVETYYPLVYVEFFSGTRKFDGRRFGKRIEESAGAEVLRRIFGGSEITKAEYGGRYYHKSLKVKKLIEQEFKKAFENIDVVVCPTVPSLPWKIGEKISVEEAYSADALTIPANLAGVCAISVPAGKINGIPVGMQIMCDKFQEKKMLEIARAVEE